MGKGEIWNGLRIYEVLILGMIILEDAQLFVWHVISLICIPGCVRSVVVVRSMEEESSLPTTSVNFRYFCNFCNVIIL